MCGGLWGRSIWVHTARMLMEPTKVVKIREVARPHRTLQLCWEFYFRWDAKQRSKRVWFLSAKDGSDSYTQKEVFKGEPTWVAHGSEAPAITQATAWTPATEVGGVGNRATSFPGALLMGNGVGTNLGLGLWVVDRGCHLFRGRRRQKE